MNWSSYRSPAMWRKFFKPKMATLISDLKTINPNLKVAYHSDGQIYPIIHDLIEIGLDVLNPIQPAAVGMAPEGLKSDFGDRLCFHGGIDVQFLLPLQSAEAVRAEVSRRAKLLGKGGGYILAPSHNLQQDTSTENIVAMYDLDLRRC